MSEAYTKNVRLTAGNEVIFLGVTQMKHELKNRLNESPIAQENAGETKNLALNLNEVTEQFIITAVFDDEVADKLNKANSINKEIAAERLETIFKSQDLVELKYGSRTDNGFIQQMTITENAKDDNKHYDVKIRFLKAEKMDTN